MINGWAVLWKDNEGAHKRKFEGDSPTEAVTFGKELKRRGFSVEVISRRRAFAPPKNAKAPDSPGILWCPYCIKYREFREIAIRDEYGLGPAIVRCIVCMISVRDAYVRRWNRHFYRRWETEQERKRGATTSQKAAKSVTKVFNPRRNRGR